MQKIFFTPAEVSDLMDKYSSMGLPFLFGFNYEMDSAFFIPEPEGQNEIKYKFGNGTNCKRDILANLTDEGLKIISTDQFEEYKSKFNIILNGLKRGDSYLANLTCRSKIMLSMEREEVLKSTHSPFALYIPGVFLCFSPERFVKIEDGIISSYPMKGTIDAALPDAENRILNDYKESCEHATIVDLIRNDLGIVSDEVWVERYRYIDKILTDRGEILQVSSDVRGRIKACYNNSYGQLVTSLLPAGSISGAPKKATVDLIAEAEVIPRGYYTGVAGLFDGRVLDSAVLIRFLEFANNGETYYRSGGGITINSRADEEYSEMIKKIYLPLNTL